MSSWQLGIDLVTTFLLASFLLFQYGNWYKHHVFVTLSVLVAWYFSLLFVFVLPIDISGVSVLNLSEMLILMITITNV